jgi:hypothetical protein
VKKHAVEDFLIVHTAQLVHQSLETSIEQLPNGGRWTTAKVVTCTECNFSWRSRTSANAVEAYKLEKEEKSKKSSKKTK